MVFHCTCGRRLAVDDGMAGRQVRCPACGGVSTVPDAAPSPPAAGWSISAPTAPELPPSPVVSAPPRPRETRCISCNNLLAEGTAFCPFCGAQASSGAAASEFPSPPPASAFHPGMPPSAFSGMPPQTSGLAVAALICAFLPGIGAAIGVILGIVALLDIRQSVGVRRGEGIAIAAIVLGFLHGASLFCLAGAISRFLSDVFR